MARAAGATSRGTGVAAGRVIAGSARGIRLAAPADGVRPLGDRLKQALFAMLERDLRGRPFLDLFAGTGAGGIEALSRGASAATFVESSGPAVGAIERNLAVAHLAGPDATVVRGDALEWLARGAWPEPFAVVLVDPPYDRPELVGAALDLVAAAGRGAVLAGDGVVVAKHASRSTPAARIGLLASVRARRFGESALTFYRWSDGEAG